MDAGTLSKVIGCPLARAEKWAGPITSALRFGGMSSPLRAAAFLAQVAHESGRLVYVREIWNPPRCAWQERYEGRADLGNAQPGDGERFRGRGLMMITGRANYQACGNELGEDLISNPERLEEPELAALSSAWFWKIHKLNELADKRLMADITRRINGGLNGLADRLALYQRACVALGVEEEKN